MEYGTPWQLFTWLVAQRVRRGLTGRPPLHASVIQRERLARLCDGCAWVDHLIAQELEALSECTADPQRRELAEDLIDVRDWLRGQLVRWTQQLDAGGGSHSR